jgi:hypothetical protein
MPRLPLPRQGGLIARTRRIDATFRAAVMSRDDTSECWTPRGVLANLPKKSLCVSHRQLSRRIQIGSVGQRPMSDLR